MKPKWIIEDFHPDNRFAELAEEVKRQGMLCEVIKYEPFESGDYKRFFKQDEKTGKLEHECVLFQGSIQLAQQLEKQYKGTWWPIIWWATNMYKCTCYYSYLGRHLFNDNYAFVTAKEAKRNIDFYFKTFGNENGLFIRPDSGSKSFTGQVFEKERIDKDWYWIEEFTQAEDLIVITSPKRIKREWRFIVSEEKVLTGSLYKEEGKLKYERCTGGPAWEKAQEVICEKYTIGKILFTFRPDPIWVVDICQGADEKYYLLEIGAFSVAGLYDCDKKIIVEVASRLAEEEICEELEKNNTPT